MSSLLSRDILLNGLMRAASGVIWVVVNAVILNELTIRESDDLFIYLNSLLFISLMTRQGVDQQAIKFCSLSMASQEDALLAVTTRILLRSVLFLAIMLCIGHALMTYFSLPHNTIVGATIVDSLLRALPATAITLFTVIGFCLQGLSKTWIGTFLIGVLFPTCIILSTLIINQFAYSHTYIIPASAFSAGIVSLLIYWTIRDTTLNLTSRKDLRLNFNFNFYLISLCGFAITWLPLFFLGIEAEGAASTFVVIQRYSLLISFGLLAVNSVIAPKIATQMVNNCPNDTNKTLKNAAWFAVAVGCLPTIFMVGSGEVVLSSHDLTRADSLIALQTLAFAQVVSLLCGPCGVVLMMTGEEQYYARVQIMGLVITLILCLMIPSGKEVVGAALATGCGLIFQNVFSVSRWLYKLHLNPTVFPWRPNGG